MSSPTSTAIARRMKRKFDAAKIPVQLDIEANIQEYKYKSNWMKEKELLRMLIGKVIDLCEI